jgi:hypothetical protein
LKTLFVPLIVMGTRRNLWPATVPQFRWTIVALSALDAPLTSTHFPALDVRMPYWSVLPLTGVKVKVWLPAPWQAHWMSWTPSAAEPPGRSRQLPPFWLTAVEVNAVAAWPGGAIATVPRTVPISTTAHRDRKRDRRVIGLLP